MSGPNSSDGRPRNWTALRADVSLWLYGTVADGVRFARPEPGTDVDDYLFASQLPGGLARPGIQIPADARAHYAGEAIRGALLRPSRRCAMSGTGRPESLALARPSATTLEFSAATDACPRRSSTRWSLRRRGGRGIDRHPGCADAATPELVAAAWLRRAWRRGGTDRPAVVRQRPDPRRVGVERAATRVDGHLGHPGGR